MTLYSERSLHCATSSVSPSTMIESPAFRRPSCPLRSQPPNMPLSEVGTRSVTTNAIPSTATSSRNASSSET